MSQAAASVANNRKLTLPDVAESIYELPRHLGTSCALSPSGRGFGVPGVVALGRLSRAVAWLIVAFVVAGSSVASADTRLPPEDTFRAYEVCQSVAETNLLDAGWMRPSPDYWDGNWLRDAFWTSGFAGPGVGRIALANFGAYLSSKGQAPTALGRNGARSQYHDDESTLIYVIWAARDGGQPQKRVSLAWSWVRSHVTSGAYWTPPGNFRTWHDTLVFTQSDVSAYNQGLYATASIAAYQLGVAEPEEVQAAAAFYRRLYRPDLGYVPASLNLDYHDASVLAGETLSRSLFGQALLDDSTVLATVRGLPRAGPGFIVLTSADGSYLDDTAFSPGSAQGRYQNGGSWLLYDILTWQAARMAGARDAGLLAERRLAGEVAMGTLHEYLPTGPVKRMGEIPRRVDYAANAYACVAVGLSAASSRPGSEAYDYPK